MPGHRTAAETLSDPGTVPVSGSISQRLLRLEETSGTNTPGSMVDRPDRKLSTANKTNLWHEKKVFAWRIGDDMSSSLVTQTIEDALKQEKVTDGLTLHSDQGSQYTSSAYFDLSKVYHFQSSMSSPGCPYDNAAMENFFGTLKTECLYRSCYSNRSQVVALVAEYIHFYNDERINLKNGITPDEIRRNAA